MNFPSGFGVVFKTLVMSNDPVGRLYDSQLVFVITTRVTSQRKRTSADGVVLAMMSSCNVLLIGWQDL